MPDFSINPEDKALLRSALSYILLDLSDSTNLQDTSPVNLIENILLAFTSPNGERTKHLLLFFQILTGKLQF
jgi:hypothetical protein